MNKTFSFLFFFLTILTIPILCQAADVTVLTKANSNYHIESDNDVLLYGTSSPCQITIESGGRAKLINFPGANSIQILSNSYLFTVSRSGAAVTFDGSDGTNLKIPATNSVQTIDFDDGEPLTLSIYDNQVMLDDQVVNTTPAAIEIGVTEPNERRTYYRDNDGDGYGNPDVPKEAESCPLGYVANNRDCDDTNAKIHPGASEICDNDIDDDCDGDIDEGCSTTSNKPNLILYQDKGWSGQIIVSDKKDTNINSSSIYDYEGVFIDFIITNYSQIDINKTFSTTLYLDGSQKLKKVLHNLNKMTGISTLDFYLGKLSSGSHTVKIVLDSSDEIDESDESDNMYSKSFIILSNIPSAPTNVSATDGTYSSYVNIAWKASTGASSYEIWRGTTSSTSSATKLGTSTSISYQDKSGTANKTYYYWVKAVNSSGTSGFSIYNSGYRKVATNSLNSISQLVGIWSIQDAVSFEVLNDGNIINFTATFPVTDTYKTNNQSSLSVTFKDVVIDPNDFSFKASFDSSFFNGWGSEKASMNGTFKSPNSAEGTWSAAKTLSFNYAYKGSGDFTIIKISSTPPVPSAPTGLSATDGEYNDKIKITWNSSSGATSYELWRNTSNNTSSAKKVGTTTSTSYEDSIEAGKTYYYWVKAINSIGNSSVFSTTDSGNSATPVSAPTGVSATDGTNALGIKITWNASSGATSYEVWRNTSDNLSSASKIGTTTKTSYSESFFNGSKIYYYWVKAVNATGTSAFSNSDSGYMKSLW